MIIIEFLVVTLLTIYCTMLVVWSLPQKKMFQFGWSLNEKILLDRIAELERKIYDSHTYYSDTPTMREILRRGIQVMPMQASIYREIRPMGLHGSIDIMAMHKDRIAYEFGRLIADEMIKRNQIEVIELEERIIFKANYLSTT